MHACIHTYFRSINSHNSLLTHFLGGGVTMCQEPKRVGKKQHSFHACIAWDTHTRTPSLVLSPHFPVSLTHDSRLTINRVSVSRPPTDFRQRSLLSVQEKKCMCSGLVHMHLSPPNPTQPNPT